MNLMSMGGVPITLMRMNGKPHSFRFEHVWVEAWVDYLPNRGTKDTKLGADLQDIKTDKTAGQPFYTAEGCPWAKYRSAE